MTKTTKVRKIDEYPPILTLNEAADLLRIARGNIPFLVEQRGLPGKRVRRQWRFDRDAILAWLRGVSPEPASGSATRQKPRTDGRASPPQERLSKRRGHATLLTGGANSPPAEQGSE